MQSRSSGKKSSKKNKTTQGKEKSDSQKKRNKNAKKKARDRSISNHQKRKDDSVKTPSSRQEGDTPSDQRYSFLDKQRFNRVDKYNDDNYRGRSREQSGFNSDEDMQSRQNLIRKSTSQKSSNRAKSKILSNIEYKQSHQSSQQFNDFDSSAFGEAASNVSFEQMSASSKSRIPNLDDEKRNESFNKLRDKQKRKILRHDIEKLKQIKKRYKDKLNMQQEKTEITIYELNRLKKKVEVEVTDLNELNQKILQTDRVLERQRVVRHRNKQFNKELKFQSAFNNQLVSEYRQMTIKQIKAVMDSEAFRKITFDEGADSVDLKYEPDPTVLNLLDEVQKFRLGQTLDDVRGDASILSGISKPVISQQAITVKFLIIKKLAAAKPGEDDEDKYLLPDITDWGNDNDVDSDGNEVKDENNNNVKVEPCQDECEAIFDLPRIDYDEIDNFCYVATFKIYQDTRFDALKTAACKFWGIDRTIEYFILTDEYFNNLSTFKDTIQNFFDEQESYQPLDRHVYATCYLIRKNTTMKTIHLLQTESIAIIDENKKDDEDEIQDDQSSKDDKTTELQGIPRKINMKEIADTVVGLETYGVIIDEKKMNQYLKMTEQFNQPNISIWNFMAGFGLFVLNYYGKILKNAFIQEYQVRKIVETFFVMESVKGIDFQHDKIEEYMNMRSDNLNFKEEDYLKAVKIENKKDMYDYLTDHFSYLFFTEGKFVQEKFRIVGPVRLRTIHTKKVECSLESALYDCYLDQMTWENTNKTKIDEVEFKECEDLGASHSITGEQQTFECHGHALDLYANQTTPEMFIDSVNRNKNALFSPSARGLNIETTLYLPRSDWWVYCQVLYEYGINGNQVLTQTSSNIQTFRLNIYQTPAQYSKLEESGAVVDGEGSVLLIFDSIKLGLYTLFFGYRQMNDFKAFAKLKLDAQFGDFFKMIWNGTVSFLNITNFTFFILLSFSYDVNDILRRNEFLDSYKLQDWYSQAQVYDSFLVLMNQIMILEFTQVSHMVALVFQLLGITAPYLGYIVLQYLIMLYLMAVIVWQVWGDRLSYLRNQSLSLIYTLALFDLKSQYLGRNFMSANQYGVETHWLLILVVLFAVVLHYSITLQYSAYFHIYYKIAQQYERQCEKHEKICKDPWKQWALGIKKIPFFHEEKDEEDED